MHFEHLTAATEAQLMTRDAQRLEAIKGWEQRAAGLIADAQAAFAHRRSLLELHIESNPVSTKLADCLTVVTLPDLRLVHASM